MHSIRFKLQSKDLDGHEGAEADIHLFANGRINGELRFGTFSATFSQVVSTDLAVASELLRIVHGGVIEEIKKLNK